MGDHELRQERNCLKRLSGALGLEVKLDKGVGELRWLCGSEWRLFLPSRSQPLLVKLSMMEVDR